MQKVITFFIKYGLLITAICLVGWMSTDGYIKGPVEVSDPIYYYNQNIEPGSYSYCDLIIFEPAMELESKYKSGASITSGFYYIGITKEFETVYFYVAGNDVMNDRDPLYDVRQKVSIDSTYRLTGIIEEHPELATMPGAISTESMLENYRANGKIDVNALNSGAKSVAQEFANSKILKEQFLLHGDAKIDEAAHTYTRTEVQNISRNALNLCFELIAIVSLLLWAICIVVQNMHSKAIINSHRN